MFSMATEMTSSHLLRFRMVWQGEHDGILSAISLFTVGQYMASTSS